MNSSHINKGGIRPAKPEEVPLLSDLIFRSKAHWGYDDAFMQAARAELTLPPDYTVTCQVFVVEEQGHIIGLCSLRALGEDAELVDLFIEPAAIGLGYGKQLWLHAVSQAKQLGYHRLLFESDPHAKGFYLAMGAKQIGETPSNIIVGRMLPRMSYDLTADTP